MCPFLVCEKACWMVLGRLLMTFLLKKSGDWNERDASFQEVLSLPRDFMHLRGKDELWIGFFYLAPVQLKSCTFCSSHRFDSKNQQSFRKSKRKRPQANPFCIEFVYSLICLVFIKIWYYSIRIKKPITTIAPMTIKIVLTMKFHLYISILYLVIKSGMTQMILEVVCG